MKFLFDLTARFFWPADRLNSNLRWHVAYSKNARMASSRVLSGCMTIE